MIVLELPNLDNQTKEDLIECSICLDKVSAYVTNKALAMRCREERAIDMALKYEQRCQMIYDTLPPGWMVGPKR